MTNDSVGRAVAPYGSWRSTISPEALVAGFVRLAEVRRDGDDLLWLEGRPEDGGRATLVRLRSGGAPEDVSPPGINVRTRVHEYGGAAFLAAGDVIVVSDFATGRLLRVGSDRSATPITPAGPFRFADMELDRGRGRILAVREDHSGPGEAVNTLVSIPLDGAAAADPDALIVLVRGQRLRLVTPARARWDAAGVAPLGPPEPALGRDGVRGRRSRARTARPARLGSSPATRPPGPPSRAGRRTGRSSWPPSPASGSACTAGTALGWRP